MLWTMVWDELISFGILIVGLVTSQDVRLVPGPSQGRLEILLNGTWGTVCHSYLTTQTASVLCGILNQPSNNSFPVSGYMFGSGSLAVGLTNVYCNGEETSLSECRLTRASSSTTCPTSYIVGIVCTDERQTAFITYGNKWIDSFAYLDVFEGDYVYCRVGNSSYIKGFSCFLSTKKCTAGGTVSTICHFNRFNTGLANCTISNWQMQDQDSVSVFINVMYPPDSLVMSHIKVLEYTAVNISLQNIPNPLPYLTTWRKTGTMLTWNQTEAYRTYKNITVADGGEFLVNISNSIKTSSGFSQNYTGLEIIRIDVLYRPVVRCGEHIVKEGAKVTITCEVDANPLPHLYLWTDGKGDIVEKGSEPRLVIESVKREQMGPYKLTAFNKMKEYTGRTRDGVGVANFGLYLDTPVSKTPVKNYASSLSTLSIVLIAVIAASVVVNVGLILVIIKCRHSNKKGGDPDIRMSERGNPADTENAYANLVMQSLDVGNFKTDQAGNLPSSRLG